MCQYFSKTEYQYSQALKQAAKEAFKNNMYHHHTMKTGAYLSNRECSVQERVYYILPELKLRKDFPAVYFVNTNQYYSLNENLANYQMIFKIFSRS